MLQGPGRTHSTALRHLHRYVLTCVVGVVACFSACGGDTPQGPTPIASAQTDAANVTTSLSPGPLTMRRAQSQGQNRASFELTGTVTFRDEGGAGFRIVSVELDLEDERGSIGRQTFPVELAIEPGGTSSYPLPESISLPMGRDPVRLRVRASGLDRGGQRRMTTAGEARLVVAESQTLGPAGLGGGEVTFVGAGDIADCTAAGSQATARLLDGIPGEVFTLGDNAYPSAEQLTKCYEPTWGRHKARTHPVLGNHDWGADFGAPYFSYFGANAGPRSGWYSFDVGAWHILALNSNTSSTPSGAQYAWVQADLAAHPSRCTLAMWHYPRFSSGPNGSTLQMQPIWSLLNNAGVDVVLSGHDHIYERFAKQDHEGMPTPRGMRSFVVGTGGTHLYGPQVVQPNSEVRGAVWGVLKLSLRADDYSWEFVPVPGSTFRDSGRDTCR